MNNIYIYNDIQNNVTQVAINILEIICKIPAIHDKIFDFILNNVINSINVVIAVKIHKIDIGKKNKISYHKVFSKLH